MKASCSDVGKLSGDALSEVGVMFLDTCLPPRLERSETKYIPSGGQFQVLALQYWYLISVSNSKKY